MNNRIDPTFKQVPSEIVSMNVIYQLFSSFINRVDKSVAHHHFGQQNKSITAKVLEQNRMKLDALHSHTCFFKWANPGLFLFIFGLFKQTIQFLQQINVKKCHVHPVYGPGI